MTPKTKNILLWAAFLFIFFYFLQVELFTLGDQLKFRIQTRGSGIGFALRMRWSGLEIWSVKHKAEIKKVFPPTGLDPVGKFENYVNRQ